MRWRNSCSKDRTGSTPPPANGDTRCWNANWREACSHHFHKDLCGGDGAQRDSLMIAWMHRHRVGGIVACSDDQFRSGPQIVAIEKLQELRILVHHTGNAHWLPCRAF